MHKHSGRSGPQGLLLLELIDGDGEAAEGLSARVRAVPGPYVEAMVFDHPA